MARVLITSGPTRQYLDPVRYLSNASSGRMGAALAAAALELGHDVVVVSGPVALEYPAKAKVVSVVSTADLLEACRSIFPDCQGLIGAAAPCDYQPVRVEARKIAKTGEPLMLRLSETPDVVATLGAAKQPHQWVVGFAMETDDQRFRALVKLEKKRCDLMVLNGVQAMNSARTSVEIIDAEGAVLRRLEGLKEEVARGIFAVIQQRLVRGQTGGKRKR